MINFFTVYTVILLSIIIKLQTCENHPLLKSQQLNRKLLKIDNSSNNEILYQFRKVGGSGCPYTASWLIHANLYRRLNWWMYSTKMEEASFETFHKAALKFQLSDPDIYYVHHMSMYEHFLHKKTNFSYSKNMSELMSQSAYRGECFSKSPSPHSEKIVSNHIHEKSQYLAIIPFYGGLPPNVTSDFKVKSIGQGNSLMSAHTKTLQCLATVCSCLKYYGTVVIGTARERKEDRVLLWRMIKELPMSMQQFIHIVSFRMKKPAHLPFNLLAWGQHYVQSSNCPPHDILEADIKEFRQHRNLKKNKKYYYAKNKGNQTYWDLHSICFDDIHRHHNPKGLSVPVYDVKYYDNWFEDSLSHHRGHHHQKHNFTQQKGTGGGGGRVPKRRGKQLHTLASLENDQRMLRDDTPTTTERAIAPSKTVVPIKYVYFTESDQVVYFESISTLLALSAALNESVFFTGPRREKLYTSPPEQYMSGLDVYRTCGETGYTMKWPSSNVLYNN